MSLLSVSLQPVVCWVFWGEDFRIFQFRTEDFSKKSAQSEIHKDKIINGPQKPIFNILADYMGLALLHFRGRKSSLQRLGNHCSGGKAGLDE